MVSFFQSGQLLPEKQSKEVKMNFTNTEFVLVEDTSRLESDGVILRSTAVLDYFPDQTPRSPGDFVTKPLLSCSLQRLEVDSYKFAFIEQKCIAFLNRFRRNCLILHYII